MAESSTPPQWPAGRTLAGYEVVEKLGQGGMGVVYRAVDRKLGRSVALKLLPAASGTDATARERFLREARTASALDHPNIGTIFGLEELPGGGLCIVMAYYEGKTLAERLAQRRLRLDEIMRIAVQTADGLAAAHAAGIIHRDVKPSNVMLTSSELVKVVDFGLAKLTGPADEQVTRTAAIMGTAAYMSPEQARGLPLDGRTDIWSLGVLLYECASGTLPFRGPDTYALLYSVVHDEPPPLESVDPELGAAVFKAMRKNPADRFRSMQEFADELRRIAHSMEVAEQAETKSSGFIAPVAPTLTPPRVSRRRISRWTIGIAAAALTLSGAAALSPGLRQRLANGLGMQAAESHTTVAVLPFTGVGDAEMTALARGLAQQLSERLTRLESIRESLTVLPPSELLARSIRDGPQAIRKMGATLVISGSLSRAGPGQVLVLDIRDARRAQPNAVTVESAAGDIGVLEDRAADAVGRVLEIEEGAQSSAALWRTGSSVAASYEHYLRGVGYMQRWDKADNREQARAEFERAATVDPQFALAHSGLAEAARTAWNSDHDPADLQTALASAQKAIRLDRKLVQGHVALGRIYHVMAGQRDLAVIEFQRALELDPRNADAIQGMATAYEELGREAEAEAALKKGVALRPWGWNGYNLLASYYFRKKRFADAEAQYRKALSVVPDNSAVYSNLGVVLAHENKDGEAVKMYQQSISLEPTYQALNNLAALYYSQRKFSDAAEVYGKALALSDRDFIVWGSRGQALLHAGAPRAEVEPALRRAIALGQQHLQVRADDVTTLGLLAVYEGLLGEKEAAVTLVNQAMTKSSVSGAAAEYCAIAYELAGDRASAVRWAQKALDTGYAWKDLRTDVEMDQLVRGSALRHSP